MIKTYTITYVICLLIIFGLIYFYGIGDVHLFELDELYFAEITREMLVTQNYRQVTFQFEPLYEKPPLFFWIQAASMHFWGINEIGARFPNIIAALLTLITLYHIGNAYQHKTFGLLWMIIYGTTFLPHFYFKSGIIDPFLNYFMLLSIYLLSRSSDATPRSTLRTIGAGLALGFALLIKGPIGAVIPFVTLGLTQLWKIGRITWKPFIIAAAIAAMTLSTWLLPEVLNNGFDFIKQFWTYHWTLYQQPVETHNQPWYYHFLILFWGCFPSSLFALAQLKQTAIQGKHYAWKAYMKTLCIVVVLIFTLVGTKIVHYSSMAYFSITFLATDFLYQRVKNSTTCNVWLTWSFLAIGIVIGSCMALLPWMMQYAHLWIKWVHNPYVIDALETPVAWSIRDSIPGIFYIIGIALAFYYLLQERFISFIKTFSCSNLLCLTLFLVHIAPKIEGYTQKAVIDFCKAYSNREVYLTTIGFKAAAPLFYACKKNRTKVYQEKNISWLLTGAIDQPSFFILYKRDKDLLAPYQDITCIKEVGCFAFYKRRSTCQPLV